MSGSGLWSCRVGIFCRSAPPGSGGVSVVREQSQEAPMTTTAAHIHRLETVDAPGAMLTKGAAKALAVTRIATGFVFLWAFLDKTFGFGFGTPAAKAWINGGSPTKGFLSSVEVGPFQDFFHG